MTVSMWRNRSTRASIRGRSARSFLIFLPEMKVNNVLQHRRTDGTLSCRAKSDLFAAMFLKTDSLLCNMEDPQCLTCLHNCSYHKIFLWSCLTSHTISAFFAHKRYAIERYIQAQTRTPWANASMRSTFDACTSQCLANAPPTRKK